MVNGLLTRKQVAQWLQVSAATVYRLSRAGELSMVRVGKRGLRYRRSAVLRFLGQRTSPAVKARKREHGGGSNGAGGLPCQRLGTRRVPAHPALRRGAPPGGAVRLAFARTGGLNAGELNDGIPRAAQASPATDPPPRPGSARASADPRKTRAAAPTRSAAPVPIQVVPQVPGAPREATAQVVRQMSEQALRRPDDAPLACLPTLRHPGAPPSPHRGVVTHGPGSEPCRA